MRNIGHFDSIINDDRDNNNDKQKKQKDKKGKKLCFDFGDRFCKNFICKRRRCEEQQKTQRKQLRFD